MHNGVLEAKVWKLEEENKELKERIDEIEKNITKNDWVNNAMFKEIMYWMKSTKEWLSKLTENFSDLWTRKDSIDKIIEKIKKLVPIK